MSTVSSFGPPPPIPDRPPRSHPVYAGIPSHQPSQSADAYKAQLPTSNSDVNPEESNAKIKLPTALRIIAFLGSIGLALGGAVAVFGIATCLPLWIGLAALGAVIALACLLNKDPQTRKGGAVVGLAVAAAPITIGATALYGVFLLAKIAVTGEIDKAVMS